MTHKLAIIDLGTNTFHLLLAELHENRYLITHREKVAAKLGLGGINQDVIQDEAIGRAIEALKNFSSTIDQYGAKTVYAFGTSALRNARNGREVTEKIKQSTGIAVAIISGDKEAEFIYQGVRSAVDLGHVPALIIDIGGGSVEFIIGNQTTIFWKKSIEVGAQRLLEKFQPHDPIAKNEIESIDQYFKITLVEVMNALHLHQPKMLVGSSGTFDTLSDIHCIDHAIQTRPDDPETPLTRESFYFIYQELITKNRKERLLIPGMIEMRVDMIVVACCLIRFLLDAYSFNEIKVSSYSLKEGVLASMASPTPSQRWEGGIGL
jgi:exopolyphosphatase/guanosine-5'-triphosphate,3'-diphosphate pyrophosphatase